MSDGNFIVFSQGTGYGMIVGLGALFAIGMVGLSWLLARYMSEVQDSEMLSTAKRSIKAGLIASAVVSSWTIGSTLLLSTTTTYQLGIAAAFWYGAGACVQIIIFAVFAIEMKRKAPAAHTFHELVATRYGKPAHLTMCCYTFVQQLFYTANLLVNGSSIFASMTGISRPAACVLLPFFVIIYTMLGGIKATFMTDWVHVVIIYVVTMIFLFKVYVTSDIIGSPEKMYDLLVTAAESYPVSGNLNGSLLTFTSVNSGLFGLILFGAGWAAAVDSQLFQKAIAAKPSAALAGYTLGGLCWFTLPYALATTMGLAGRALEDTSDFALYPDRLSSAQISNGLVLPVAAYSLMGLTGVGMVLLIVFMACTASFSSELVAVSSLWTYDIYRTYINPDATGKRILFVQHASFVIFSCCVIALAIGLGEANFDVSFITTCVGIFVNVNVIPMALTLFWKKMSGFAMIASTTLGSAISIAVWFGVAYSESKVITMTTLSSYGALSAGNTMAVGIPIILVPIFVWIKPANFDFGVWKEKLVQVDDSEFDKDHGLTTVLSGQDATELILEKAAAEEKHMIRSRNYGIVVATVFVLFFLILFPIPLYGLNYVFTKKFFKGYIIVTFLWVFFSVGVVTVYPVVESLPNIKRFFSNIMAGKTTDQKSEVIEGTANIDGVLSSEKNATATKVDSVSTDT